MKILLMTLTLSRMKTLLTKTLNIRLMKIIIFSTKKIMIPKAKIIYMIKKIRISFNQTHSPNTQLIIYPNI
jgi:hypothetical protein